MSSGNPGAELAGVVGIADAYATLEPTTSLPGHIIGVAEVMAATGTISVGDAVVALNALSKVAAEQIPNSDGEAVNFAVVLGHLVENFAPDARITSREEG